LWVGRWLGTSESFHDECTEGVGEQQIVFEDDNQKGNGKGKGEGKSEGSGRFSLRMREWEELDTAG